MPYRIQYIVQFSSIKYVHSAIMCTTCYVLCDMCCIRFQITNWHLGFVRIGKLDFTWYFNKMVIYNRTLTCTNSTYTKCVSLRKRLILFTVLVLGAVNNDGIYLGVIVVLSSYVLKLITLAEYSVLFSKIMRLNSDAQYQK